VIPGDDDANHPLRPVGDMVGEMEAALTSGRLAIGTGLADALVALTTELLDEIDLDPSPDLEKEAELISTLRVYRNAAFVFRRLAGADGEPDRAMKTLCINLIEQGHDHWRAFMGQTPRERKSKE
jgi:hypothetical protein